MSNTVNLSDVSVKPKAPLTDKKDIRHIETGFEIPTRSYSDQPFLIKAADGAWICCVTTGLAEEGNPGQHVTTLRSTDKGMTWSSPLPVEPPGSPENSYAVMTKTPSGRIYIFYNYNGDNIREIIADNPPYSTGLCSRVDSLGDFVFRYSDDNGKSWSENRYKIPVREFLIDKTNPYKGEIRFFWNVGKPFVIDGEVYVSIHKVGGIGEGFFTSSQGALVKSSNLMTEQNPEKITWETLPDGDIGLKTPEGGGPISEEQSYSVMDDKSIYVVYRTADGYPVETYSRDKGHTFEEPQYKRYADGRLMKNPRAANFAWKCENGKYLYWFHNHNGRDYEDRNPVWVSGGIEADSENGRIIKWTQPEILLYDDDTFVRMSYPDLLEQNGEYFISETQKDIARVHKIPNEFLDTLWSQLDINTEYRQDILAEQAASNEIKLPSLPHFAVRNWHDPAYRQMDTAAGFTLDFWLDASQIAPSTCLADNLTADRRGFKLYTDDRNNLTLYLSDGQTASVCTIEDNAYSKNEKHHISVIIDGGPRIVSFVADDRFCDGGEYKQFGFCRFSPYLRDINGNAVLKLSDKGISKFKLYSKAIMTTQAIGNYRAGL